MAISTTRMALRDSGTEHSRARWSSGIPGEDGKIVEGAINAIRKNGSADARGSRCALGRDRGHPGVLQRDLVDFCKFRNLPPANFSEHVLGLAISSISTMCPVLSSALDSSLPFTKAETFKNTFKTLQKLPSTGKEQKARIYFGTSKFHHKLRAKRKKDREKEVFTLDSVFEACMNGKNCEILRNLSKKVELRFGHSVETWGVSTGRFSSSISSSVYFLVFQNLQIF